MNFVKFTEHNDHEGETWNFWLQKDGNEKELDKLFDLMTDFGVEEEFELDMREVPESEVDILVKHSLGGYMNDHNKVTGTFTCPEMPEGTADNDEGAWDWIQDNFYKGGIERHFK